MKCGLAWVWLAWQRVCSWVWAWAGRAADFAVFRVGICAAVIGAVARGVTLLGVLAVARPGWSAAVSDWECLEIRERGEQFGCPGPGVLKV